MAESPRPSELQPDGFEEYNTQLQGAALKATKHAVGLPSDLEFYRSVDKNLAKQVDACSSRVLSIANQLLDLASTGENTSKTKGKRKLENADDVTDNFRSLVVDAMDHLLERADICLDDFLGLHKPPAIPVNPKPAGHKPQTRKSTPSGRLDPNLQHASHLPKPQLGFKRKVDNNDIPWRPSLRHKYNAQVPLGYDLRHDDGDGSMNGSSHPYRHEIKHISYPSHMFKSSEPVFPKSFEDTTFSWVATPTELSTMLDSLRVAREIAVDLEYHSYRSYLGFVCLMQISTREGDWIVDTLLLREELEELNEVFTDPKIVKVFHGAESDIVWLQQDFNLYIVNLFDTYHASKVLDFPRHSLATLMEMYCDFTPDKRYQLADWRIRPLPDEMLHYARSDTHFLLFIYDNLRNALLDRALSRAQSRAQSPADAQCHITPTAGDPAYALVKEVLARSEGTALRVYEKEVYDAEGGSGPGGWDVLARKWNKGALMADARENVVKRIYTAVHGWRDRVAREEDESIRYVLPNHYIFTLAEQPPADMAALLAVFQHIPHTIRRRAKELYDCIKEAQRGRVVAEVVPAEMVTDVPKAAPLVAADGRETTMTESVKLSSASKRLWSLGLSTIRASGSSLLNTGAPAAQKHVPYIASNSAFFSYSGSLALPDNRRQHFQEVVARIHGTLVVAPSAPKMNSVSTVSKTEVADMEVESVAGQIEVPFVPASQRQDTKAKMLEGPVQDTIVIVGQASQRKKRKRGAKKDIAVNSQSEASEGGAQATEEMAFDYSTVSNILDEGSDHEPEDQPGKRKRKQKAQARYDYGNFGAPPKAHSEVKSGNQSRTFR